jgi:dCTP deaminase
VINETVSEEMRRAMEIEEGTPIAAGLRRDRVFQLPSYYDSSAFTMHPGETPKAAADRMAGYFPTIHHVPGGLMPDFLIRKFCKIDPFVEMGENPAGVIGYGLSSTGYDIRIGYVFKVFTNANQGTIVDPKAFDPNCFNVVDLTPNGAHVPVSVGGDAYSCSRCGKELVKAGDIINPPCPMAKPNYVVIPPNSFILAESVEYVEIPRECSVLVLGKSTYARCGIVANFTPLEPGWRGKITMEFSNTTPLPAKMYCGEGAAQLLFFKTSVPCAVDYDQKPSKKYQDQKGLTDPIGSAK